jgi:hypothetical protein
MEIVEETPYRFVIPRRGRMRVPGAVCATRAGRYESPAGRLNDGRHAVALAVLLG